MALCLGPYISSLLKNHIMENIFYEEKDLWNISSRVSAKQRPGFCSPSPAKWQGTSLPCEWSISGWYYIQWESSIRNQGHSSSTKLNYDRTTSSYAKTRLRFNQRMSHGHAGFKMLPNLNTCWLNLLSLKRFGESKWHGYLKFLWNYFEMHSVQ